MKALLAAVTMAVSVSAQAEFAQMGTNCGTTESFVKFFEEYNMLPVLYSDTAQILDADGQPIKGEMTTWLSDNGEYAVLITSGGASCMVIGAEGAVKWTNT